MSLVGSFASLSDLLDDAELVVQAAPIGVEERVPADRDGRSGVMADISTLRIESVLSGSSPRDGTVRVRQLHGICSRGVDLMPEISYVLFLKPFTFAAPDRPRDEYVIAGTTGAYRVSGPWLTLAAVDAGLLPDRLTMSELRTALSNE